MTDNIVYCVKDEGLPMMNYIGLAEDMFKRRHSNHATMFRLIRYHYSTALSKYIWEIKDKQSTQSKIKLSRVWKTKRYAGGEKFCKLCQEEKLMILMFLDPGSQLNKRAEITMRYLH